MANRSEIESQADAINLDQVVTWYQRGFVDDGQGGRELAYLDRGGIWMKLDGSNGVLSVEEVGSAFSVQTSEEEREYLARDFPVAVADQLGTPDGLVFVVTSVEALTRRRWLVIRCRAQIA